MMSNVSMVTMVSTMVRGARRCGVVLPLALLLPLLVGCGGTPATNSATSSAATGPITAETPARWQAVNPPPGAATLTSLAVSSSDGADAWDCESSDPYTYRIWATTDAGAQWHQAGTIAASHGANATSPVYCRLYTDQGDPQVLAADFNYLPRPPDPNLPAGYDLSYISQDGGATWHLVPGKVQVEALTTSGSSLYALVDDTSVATFKPHLVVSTDGLTTSHSVPLPAASGASPGGMVSRLYGGPGADGLIVAAGGLPLEHLNTSTGTWTPIHLPPTTTPELQGQQMPITWLPTQHTWMICIGVLNFSKIPPQTGFLRCTTDDGATWRDRSFPTDASGAPLQAANSGWACVPTTLTSGGALLAWCETTAANLTPVASEVPAAKPGHMFLLASSSSRWVDFGPLGGGDFGISAMGQVVWSFGANGTAWVTDLSHLSA